MALISLATNPWYKVTNLAPDYIEETFKFAKGCGVEAIDFSFHAFLNTNIREGFEGYDGFFDKSEEELIELFRPVKEMSEKYGIAFSQSHAPFPIAVYGEDEDNRKMISIIEKCMVVCQFLGCPAIVIHPYVHELKEVQHEVTFFMCRSLIPMAKRTGVKVCLENVFRRKDGHIFEGNCEKVEEACYFIDTLNEEAGEDLFGFCFDIGHATVRGINPYRFVKALGHRLTILHIQESDSIHDSHMIPFTQIYDEKPITTGDWEGFLQGLKEIGYKGNISFECGRGILVMPEEVRKEVMCLITAIGRYIRNKISEA